MNPSNVVIWARVSSREQAEGYSLDAQIRITRAKAEREGWNVLREFVVAESAKRGAERLVFNDMYAWVKKHAKRMKIEYVLSHKLDRICRNMRDAVRMQDLEDSCGVKLTFIDNEFGPGAAGALSFNVMAAISQYYSDNLRQEVRKGMDEKVRQGWLPAWVPYGYLNCNDRNEPIKVHADRAKFVVRMFELFSRGEMTLEMVSDQLYKEGFVYRPTTPKITFGSVSALLHNRFYVGDIVWHGQIYPGKHVPLIDRGTWQRVQDILNGKSRRRQSGLSHTFGAGLFTCQVCGRTLTGERIRRQQADGSCRVHHYYRCADNHPGPDHPRVRWREDAIDKAVLAELEKMRLPSEETADWFRVAIRKAFSDMKVAHDSQMRLLARRAADLERQHERLLTVYVEGHLDAAIFQDRSASLQGQIGETTKAMESCRVTDDSCGDLAVKVYDFTQKAAEIWKRSNPVRKQTILRAISLNRAASDVTLYLEKRKPFSFLAERLPVLYGRGDRI